MKKRQNIPSGSIWEERAGYSRAVRFGDMVCISGTTASDESGHVHGSDAREQSLYIFRKIERALLQAGASLNDVVRTRIYVSDLAHWEGAAYAHKEIFGDIMPANTLIGGIHFPGTGYLVEIEADAIIGAGASQAE
ncbi:MAG: RidA family protein [Anaerolineaceae bacterium]|nr:RidA family protein [Anaerolineaceae bacterium]